MTINEIIKHASIHQDRFGLAAISCIFKAFGDNIRSKEYWPWGKDVQCEWYESLGTDKDIDQAILLLKRSKLTYEDLINDSDYWISLFKVKSVENNYKESSNLYKITVDTIYYYNKDDTLDIVELKKDDLLILKEKNNYSIFNIENVISIGEKILIIKRLSGTNKLNINSILQIYRINK